MRGLTQDVEISQLSREHEHPEWDQSQVPIGTPDSGVASKTAVATSVASEHVDGLSADVSARLLLAQDHKGAAPENTVIGVICAGDIAVYRDEVKAALERGLAQRPNAVWVCLESKSDRITQSLLLSIGVDPVVLPMVQSWKNDLGDWRRTWRDLEMLNLCDELIVFHKRAGNSPWRDRHSSGLHRSLFVVELGPEKARKRKKASA